MFFFFVCFAVLTFCARVCLIIHVSVDCEICYHSNIIILLPQLHSKGFVTTIMMSSRLHSLITTHIWALVRLKVKLRHIEANITQMI